MSADVYGGHDDWDIAIGTLALVDMDGTWHLSLPSWAEGRTACGRTQVDRRSLRYWSSELTQDTCMACSQVMQRIEPVSQADAHTGPIAPPI